MAWIIDPSINTDDYEAFVYLITNTVTGKKYIGKKAMWQRRKGQSDCKSDWENYWGSSDYLHEDITKYGQDKFTREVLHWCFTRGDSTYLEAKELFARDVLASDEYYNKNILSTFFTAPGKQTQRKKLKVVKKRPRITLKLKQLIWNHDGAQKQIADEYDLSVSTVSKIQKENPEWQQ